MGTIFNATGNTKGVWGHDPRQFSNLKALKRHFQHSQANSLSKRLRKLIVIFSTLTKIALSSAVVYFHN